MLDRLLYPGSIALFLLVALSPYATAFTLDAAVLGGRTDTIKTAELAVTLSIRSNLDTVSIEGGGLLAGALRIDGKPLADYESYTQQTMYLRGMHHLIADTNLDGFIGAGYLLAAQQYRHETDADQDQESLAHGLVFVVRVASNNHHRLALDGEFALAPSLTNNASLASSRGQVSVRWTDSLALAGQIIHTQFIEEGRKATGTWIGLGLRLRF